MLNIENIQELVQKQKEEARKRIGGEIFTLDDGKD